MSDAIELEIRNGSGWYYTTLKVPMGSLVASSWVLTACWPHGEEHLLADEVSRVIVAWLEAGNLAAVSVVSEKWRQ